MATLTDQESPIVIKGARQNNLKGIDVLIPSNRLTVITGVSGSGKSSLAFDTLYAEGQRRYVESLSAYARQFLERLQKPQVDDIVGIRPAIAIRQRNNTRNPRSTVGTVTEIYDFLRLLFSRAGIIRCHSCGEEVNRDSIDEVVEQLLRLAPGTRLLVSFPFRGSHLDLNSDREEKKTVPAESLLENLQKQGFRRLLNPAEAGRITAIDQSGSFTLSDLETLNVLVDRLVIGPDLEERLTDSLETCFAEGNGVAEVLTSEAHQPNEWQRSRFTERFECRRCAIEYRSPEPALFSFNNPYGACRTCHGFGNTISLDPNLVIPDPNRSIVDGPIDPFTKPRYRRFQRKLEEFVQKKGLPLTTRYQDLPEDVRSKIWSGVRGFPGVVGFFSLLEKKKYKMHVRIFISRYRGYTRCPDCQGERLCREARDVYIGDQRITQLTRKPIRDVVRFFEDLQLTGDREKISEKLLAEIRQRLRFLVQVGLDYLTLDRLTSTLSGGEMQRIHLAASLGSSLVGTLYVLDEPSVGLHPRDEQRLIQILQHLRDLGNTIVVVEHERDMIEAADHVIDLGPGAGEQGGRLLHSGDLDSLKANPKSLTARYLVGNSRIPVPVFRKAPNSHKISIRGARQHNLKDLSVDLPLGLLICITGVSGSGKSTLVHHVLFEGLRFTRGESAEPSAAFDSIEGGEYPSEILLVDQSPIGKTPRSNPVTYIKAFDDIRAIFASLRDAEARNLPAGAFSFNIPGGRCETCQGAGTVTVEMQFLADVELLCEDCRGSRYQSRVLEVRYRGKNIAEVLDLTVDEAAAFFKSHRRLVRKLQVLQEVGLGYLRLGQSATTLSGGEAQRIKLASYLARPTSKQPLFIFDEPTTGLHFEDIGKLLTALAKLTAKGASVIVIEHNLDVIKSADWVIDLGPEGGEGGGRLVAQGTPEEVAECPASHTGRFLSAVLAVERYPADGSIDAKSAASQASQRR